MKFLTFAAVVLFISIALRYTSLIIRRIKESSQFGKKLHVLEPVLSLLVWIIVIFWGVNFLFGEKPYYNFIIFALIALVFASISWFFVKDLMAGIAFKLQNEYLPGDIVQFGQISGKLNELLLTHVSIYSNDGKLVKIPYSRLSNEIISQKSVGGSFNQNQYLLNVPKKYSVEKTREILLNLLINSPWRIRKKAAAVYLKAETSEAFDFQIQVETRNEKHFNYLITILKRRFDID